MDTIVFHQESLLSRNVLADYECFFMQYLSALQNVSPFSSDKAVMYMVTCVLFSIQILAMNNF